MIALFLWTAVSWAGQVHVEAGADLYTDANLVVDDESRALLPVKDVGRHCVAKGDLRGDLMAEVDGVAFVRLTEPAGCGLLFRPKDGVVFTRAAKVSQEPCAKPNALREAADAAETKRILETMTPSVSMEKSEEELERYLACYKTDYQANYDRLYKRAFNLAGRVFRVSYRPGQPARVTDGSEATDVEGYRPALIIANPTALKCIGRRESRWDPRARSETGARGLGQQTTIAVKEMTCLLEGCVGPDGRPKKAQAWARETWDNFFATARAEYSPAEWSELTNQGACKPVMRVKDRDAVCPLNSIAALAVDYVAAELAVRRKDPRYQHEDVWDYQPREAFSKTLSTATANNSGRGNLGNAVAASSDPSEWVATMAATAKDSEQVGEYARVLRNCLRRGNFNAPSIPKEGEKPSSCAEKAARKSPGAGS